MAHFVALYLYHYEQLGRETTQSWGKKITLLLHIELLFFLFFLASQNYWIYSVAFFLAELQPPEIKSSVLFYHSELQ